MNWAQPEYFIAFIIVGIVGIISYYRIRAQKKVIHILQGNNAFVIRNYSPLFLILKAVLITIVTFFLVISLARPQWGKREDSIKKEGRDVFIVLDISRSMLAQDQAPNRLEAAKSKIKILLEYLPCERIGLILFSGSAFVQCPLTSDAGTFMSLLDNVDVETIASGTTSLSVALLESIAAFQRSGKEKNKLVLLITDGEDFSRISDQVKTQAKDNGIHLFTYGIGTTEGAPVPRIIQGKQEGHERNKDGSVAISKLNKPLLQSLSKELGGLYIDYHVGKQDIKTIVQAVEGFEKDSFEERSVQLYVDRYHYFALIALVCLGIAWLL